MGDKVGTWIWSRLVLIVWERDRFKVSSIITNGRNVLEWMVIMSFNKWITRFVKRVISRNNKCVRS